MSIKSNLKIFLNDLVPKCSGQKFIEFNFNFTRLFSWRWKYEFLVSARFIRSRSAKKNLRQLKFGIWTFWNLKEKRFYQEQCKRLLASVKFLIENLADFIFKRTHNLSLESTKKMSFILYKLYSKCPFALT